MVVKSVTTKNTFIPKILCFSLIMLLSACSTTSQPKPFKQLSAEEISKIVGNVEEPSSSPWLNYIFDLQIVASNGRSVLQSNPLSFYPPSGTKDTNVQSTHNLIRATSIGTRDDVKTVSLNTGLWKEDILDRTKATVAIELVLKPSEKTQSLSPDTGENGIKAHLYCEEWAQALETKNLVQQKGFSKKQPYEQLKQAFIDNWKKRRPLQVEIPLSPYKIGAYWVIPTIVELEKDDFRSNCL